MERPCVTQRQVETMSGEFAGKPQVRA